MWPGVPSGPWAAGGEEGAAVLEDGPPPRPVQKSFASFSPTDAAPGGLEPFYGVS